MNRIHSRFCAWPPTRTPLIGGVLALSCTNVWSGNYHSPMVRVTMAFFKRSFTTSRFIPINYLHSLWIWSNVFWRKNLLNGKSTRFDTALSSFVHLRFILVLAPRSKMSVKWNDIHSLRIFLFVPTKKRRFVLDVRLKHSALSSEDARKECVFHQCRVDRSEDDTWKDETIRDCIFSII